MWRLKKIYAENVCAFRKLDWGVPQNITTLIFGDNMDNESQRSNGSGKSALIEAVAIGLTGDPLRKAKIDEIINDNEDDATVYLELENKEEKQTLKISRHFFRKSPQNIGVAINGKHQNKSSVIEYNKYILDLLGLTKDDIFSSFILSEHKYVSFISSKDNDKKDLINRFSNGIMVDEAIVALEADIAPVKESLSAAEKSVSYLEGAVSALSERIEAMKNEEGSALAQREQHKQSIKESISSHRAYIRSLKDQIVKINADWDIVEKIDTKLSLIEDGDFELEEAFDKIKTVWNVGLLGELDDAKKRSRSLKGDVISAKSKVEECRRKRLGHQNMTNIAVKVLNKKRDEYEHLKVSIASRTKELEDAIVIQRSIISQNNSLITDCAARRREAGKFIASIESQLMGTIKCPDCGHEWVVGAEKSVEELRDLLARAQNRLKEIEAETASAIEGSDAAKIEIGNINSQITSLNEQVSESHKEVLEKQMELNRSQGLLNEVIADHENAISELGRLEQQFQAAGAEMFDKAFASVDSAIDSFKLQIKRHENAIETHEGTISSLESSLAELENTSFEDAILPLKESLEDKQLELEEGRKNLGEVKAELDRLNLQGTRFKEFKTFLANTKIAALSQMTNEFLEKIGSDIRISFSGYTILKSGKIRDKISISLLRDGVDCGSFGKFSGGERSRAELATILALQKLTNINCPDGKGLDLLILDEILEAVDEDGLAAIFKALNDLKMTSLVVSHGNIAENYPHKLIIHKQNGVSFINAGKT